MRSSYLATGLAVGTLFFCACDSARVPIGSPNIEVNPTFNDETNVILPGRETPEDNCGETGQACAAHDDCCGGFFCNDGGSCEAVNSARGDFSTYFSGTMQQMNAPAPGSGVDCTCNDQGDFVCESPIDTVRVTLVGNLLTFFAVGPSSGPETISVTIDANGGFTGPMPLGEREGCGASHGTMAGNLNRNAAPRTITGQGEGGNACCVATMTFTLTDVGANFSASGGDSGSGNGTPATGTIDDVTFDFGTAVNADADNEELGECVGVTIDAMGRPCDPGEVCNIHSGSCESANSADGDQADTDDAVPPFVVNGPETNGDGCGGAGQACAAHADCCGGFFCNEGRSCEAVDGTDSGVDLTGTWIFALTVTDGTMAAPLGDANLESLSEELEFQNNELVYGRIVMINGEPLDTELLTDGMESGVDVSLNGTAFDMTVKVTRDIPEPDRGLVESFGHYIGTFLGDDFIEGTFTLTNRYQNRSPSVESVHGTFTMARY